MNITSRKETSATSKYLRISSSKVSIILKKIRGKSYKDSLLLLKHLPQKSSVLIWQTLYSAISNAIHNLKLDKEKLIISEAFVNNGPILKRMRPRARGRSFAIQKKMSHITIRVTEVNI